MPDPNHQTRTLWQRVHRLVRGEAPLPPKPSVPEPSVLPGGEGDDRSALARRMRDLLRDHGSATAGALQIIDLGRIRSALQVNGRWNRLRMLIETIVASVIRHHLDSVDVFVEVEGPASAYRFDAIDLYAESPPTVV